MLFREARPPAAQLGIDDGLPAVRSTVDTVASAPGIDALIGGPTPELVRDLLHEVIDPELGLDIVELGLLRSVTVEGGHVSVVFTVTTPACPLSSYIEDEIRTCLLQVGGIERLDVAVEMEPPWVPEDMTEDARLALGWGP